MEESRGPSRDFVRMPSNRSLEVRPCVVVPVSEYFQPSNHLLDGYRVVPVLEVPLGSTVTFASTVAERRQTFVRTEVSQRSLI